MVTNVMEKTKAGKGDWEYWRQGAFLLPNFKLSGQETSYQEADS